MTDTITIPLNKLAPWSGNVRKTGARDGIAELAASIAAHGLLQSLVVREGKRGKYDIIAGRRRYLAIRSLVESGTLPKNHPVPCMLATDTVDATELSLAENVIRAPMHPADQFEAFQMLAAEGATPADIAARFGLSEIAVAQRLKLGRLSPSILAAYREADIDLEAAQAFTVTDDHAAQERVYAQLTSWNRQPHTIRRLLTEHDVPTTDKRVRFVGIEAYHAAGGTIRQDLFCEDGTGYLTDTDLLNRLAAEKLATVAAELQAEGWLWIDTAADADHDVLRGFTRRYPNRSELSEADQTELDALSEEYDFLVDSDDEANADRLSAIDARMDQITARTETWSSATLAIAGAIVTLDYDGDIRIERGLVRKEDLAKTEARNEQDAAEHVGNPAGRAASGLSPRLIEELTAEKSAAIAAEMLGYPDIALTAVVHALALDAFFPGYASHSCLKLRLTAPGLAFSMAKPDASKSLSALVIEKSRLADHLPGNPADLWDWCLARSRDELLGLLSFLAASAVDAVHHKNGRGDNDRLIHGEALARTVNLDMTAWYTPTADGYFNRVQRSQIFAAIDEAKGGHGPALDKLKKSELAIRAEQILSGTGWIPSPLRAAPTPVAKAGDEPVLNEAAE